MLDLNQSFVGQESHHMSSGFLEMKRLLISESSRIEYF
jgi:hypothetical protein